MKNKIIEVIARMIKVEAIDRLKSDITLNYVAEYSIDSLSFIKIIVEIEKTFNIEIDDDYIGEMYSVQNILGYIAQIYEN